jgi:hypothetical protein
MTLRLCRACSQWHELDDAWPRECGAHFTVRTNARSDLPRPMVISDDIDLASPVSGERFTSKSDLRRHYRANGVVEVGNDRIKPRDNDNRPIKDIEADVAKAFQQHGV